MVVVSSGFHRTHLTIAAREAAVRGELLAAIAGAYPTVGVKQAARAVRLEHGRIARLLEREESIPPERLRPVFAPELLDEAARSLKRIPLARAGYPVVSAACMRLYGVLAARELTRIGRPGDVYHFRAGFGHASIRRARQLGMVTLCDHAAVHPTLSEMLVPVGRGDQPNGAPRSATPRSPIQRAVLSDIEAADAVVVNSDFIRKMFLDLGFPPERVYLVYLGVDQTFLAEASKADAKPSGTSLRLMFAGRVDRAKGADVLISALRELNSVQWELVIAGPVAPDLRREHQAFFADPRVTALGTINRRELARKMKESAIFVFPSPSEGSARVVFEALACGCYVITTPNAGSIVRDGIHGTIVQPGDARQLTEAITRAAAQPDHLLEVGQRNAKLVAHRFTQADYGDALSALYRLLSTERPIDQLRNAQSSTFVAPNSG